MLTEELERSNLSEFMVSYSVEKNPNRVLNSDCDNQKSLKHRMKTKPGRSSMK